MQFSSITLELNTLSELREKLDMICLASWTNQDDFKPLIEKENPK